MTGHAPLPAWLNAHAPAAEADLSTPGRKSRKYRAPSSAPVQTTTTHEDTPQGLVFNHPVRFWWKTALLAVTTLALVPILLYQSELGAQVYLWFLVVVHVVGLGIFAWGVGRHDIAPSTWGFAGRVIGLVVVSVLLYFVSKGLQGTVGGVLFWGSLFAIWALHTGGLALLHLRGARETTCPFV